MILVAVVLGVVAALAAVVRRHEAAPISCRAVDHHSGLMGPHLEHGLANLKRVAEKPGR